MTDSIQTRVARGVALLDEKLPGWAERIDLGRLDLSSACDCILGQEFRAASRYRLDYEVAVSGLFDGSVPEVIRHGFSSADSEWGLLQGEWKRVVLARRGGAR